MLQLTELTTGDTLTLPVSCTTHSDGDIAQLGNLSFPLNVQQPLEHAGDLSAFMPDSWRGLAGFRAIIVPFESVQGQWSHRDLLRDYVIQGGTLLVATPAEQLGQVSPLFPDAPFALRLHDGPPHPTRPSSTAGRLQEPARAAT